MLRRDFSENRGLPLLQESDKKEKGELQVDCVGNIEVLNQYEILRRCRNQCEMLKKEG